MKLIIVKNAHLRQGKTFLQIVGNKMQGFNEIKWDTKLLNELCKVSGIKDVKALKRNVILLCLMMEKKLK